MPDNYHDDYTHVSQSMLKIFASDRRLYHGIVTGEIHATAPTDGMRLGTLVHAAILEPDTLSRYVVPPADVLTSNGHRRGKAWNAWVESVGSENIVTASEMEAATAMAASVRAKVGDWIDHANAVIEEPIYWTDEASGVACKCKPDLRLHVDDRVAVADVKTTTDPSPTEFRRSARRFNYGLQSAHYIDGVRTVVGTAPYIEWYWVVVGSKAPYTSAVYKLSFSSRLDAMEQRENLLRDLAECQASGDWRNPWEYELQEIDL